MIPNYAILLFVLPQFQTWLAAKGIESLPQTLIFLLLCLGNPSLGYFKLWILWDQIIYIGNIKVYVHTLNISLV